MAEIKGTNVASKIVPYTDSDEYATHDEKYGVGGYRTVDSVSEMNAIPAARRKEGMLVYVKNDRYYRLNSSNTFVDAGIINSGSDVQIYQVNIAKLNFNTILDGSEATNDQINEAGECVTAWLNNSIVLYNDPTYFLEQGGYVGTLNMSFNYNENTVCFILPHNEELGSGAYLYRLDNNSNTWNVVPLDGAGSGSSNIKVLTTSSLFERNRNNAITLNANDTTIIKSLFNNQYKNVQLYYLGANSIYPVNVYSASFSSTSPSTGNMVFLSTTSETGVPNAEVITYSNSTNTFKTGSNSQISNEIVVDNYNLSQNGYVKFQTGLMIQWGYNSGSNVNPLTIYMPNSFYDTGYLVFGNIIKNATDTITYTFCPLINSYVGSFKVDRNFNSGSIGTSSAKFCWYAIGRWK